MKKNYHKGNVREGLVEAAERVLQDEGLKALSLRRVAREVGVAPSAVYNHFKNLEALLAAVAADGYRQLAALEQAAYTSSAEPGAMLRGLARDYLEFGANNPNLYRLMFSPAVVGYRSDPELGAAGDSSFGLSVDWWCGKGSYDPSVSAVNYPTALSTWALLHGLTLQMIDGLITVGTNQGNSIETLAQSTMDIFIEGAARHFPENT
jgi:AcrR family transcriptional regulator